MKRIPLTQGKFTVVDDEDFEFLNQWKWYALKSNSGKYYAVRAETISPRKQRQIKMHRLLLGLEDPNIQVDHIDEDPLNNCRTNLRACTAAENKRNVRNRSTNTSGFKGVSFNRALGKWKADIRTNGKLIYLGYYTDKVCAAKAYDEAAKQYHGEFASLNFR